MKSLIFISIFIFVVHATFAQAPDIIWEHGFGGNYDDRAMDVIEAPDGGILTVGYSNSIDGDVLINKGQRDCLVIKTNANGDIEWSKTYGGSANDYCYSVCLTNDNGFILAGETWSNDFDVTGFKGGSDYWIVKIDSVGNIIWQKTFGGSQFEVPHCIIKTISGDYLVAGISSSLDGDVTGHHGGIDNVDYWILKINDAGELIWQNSYGSSDTDDAKAIIETNDGNIIVSGYSRGYNGDVSSNYGNADYWIIKLSSDGELIWENSFGGSDTDIAHDIIESPSGSLYCIGETYSDDGLIPDSEGFIDTWIVKINPSTGILLDSYTFGGPDADAGSQIVQVSENELVFTASSQSVGGDITVNNGQSDYWLVSIDTLGNIMWQKSVGGSNYDIAYALAYTTDSNFVIAGMSYSTDLDVTETYTGYNFWVVKMGQCNNVYFADTDGDGFGNITSDTIACNIPLGYVTDSTDCDDTNPSIHPTLTDICNAIDDNCNGITDEDATFVTYFVDNDGDLFGNEIMDSTSCFILIGYVENNLDCNDDNPDIKPFTFEICNAIDDNCNTDIDEGLAIFTLYADTDGDAYGNPATMIDTCIESILGYVTNSLDCNDSLATIYPGATELCNYLDDDCDGLADENLTYILSYQDADNDNFGNNNIDSLSCELPTGFVLDSTDCNDTNPDIYPGAPELLNGLDDDCDQIADEGLAITDIVKNTISIFPNPVNAILFIQSDVTHQITIVNQLGEEILHTDLLIGLNSISVADFASGVYWVKVENGEMVVWVKGE